MYADERGLCSMPSHKNIPPARMISVSWLMMQSSFYSDSASLYDNMQPMSMSPLFPSLHPAVSCLRHASKYDNIPKVIYVSATPPPSTVQLQGDCIVAFSPDCCWFIHTQRGDSKL